MKIADRWTAPNGKRFAIALFTRDERIPKHYCRFGAYRQPDADAAIVKSEWAKFKTNYQTGYYIKAGTLNTDVTNPTRVSAGDVWVVFIDPEPAENEYGRIEL